MDFSVVCFMNVSIVGLMKEKFKELTNLKGLAYNRNSQSSPFDENLYRWILSINKIISILVESGSTFVVHPSPNVCNPENL